MRSVILALALSAGAAQGDAWDHLYGGWRGTGEVNGMAAEVELEFRKTLDGRGRHLSFANRMTAKDGEEWMFRAEALYLCNETGACRGHWYDSRGVILPLAVVTHEDKIVVDWGDATTERRTTYLVTPDRRLEVTDEVLGKDGGWKVFGRTSSRRVSGLPSPVQGPRGTNRVSHRECAGSKVQFERNA